MVDAPNILIVDDEPAILLALQMAFEGEPWVTHVASSTEQALEIMHETRFAALLVDKNLPGASGIELVRKLRARDTVSGVVMMTGFASSTSAVEALNLGVDSYIEKPFRDIFSVPEAVRRALAAADRRRDATDRDSVRSGVDGAPLRSSPPNLGQARAPTPANGQRRVSAVTEPARAGAELPSLSLVVAAASPDLCRELEAHLPGRDARHATASIAQLTRRLESVGADLVVIGSAGWDPAEVVAAVRAAADDAKVVMIGPRLSVVTIRRLIELGVKAFVDDSMGSPEFQAKLGAALDVYRIRKRLGGTP